MKQEDIGKAAKEYVYKARASFAGITPEEYEEQINPEYPYNVGTDEDFESLFISGANWRINSVWHDAGETPRPHKNAVVQTKEYGALLLGPDMDEITYKWLCKTIGITSWAYIGDLLPNMEE